MVSPIAPRPGPGPAVNIRAPLSEDGAAVHALVGSCPPLDANSLYCNLLQCTHFAATCALAESEGEVVGFVSAYMRPDRPDTLFIWQVAVAASARGAGLGRRMILDILGRADCADAKFLSTTITAGNVASWALFESLARSLRAAGRRRVLFDGSTHFGGTHETEYEFVVGPLDGLVALQPTTRHL